MTCRRCKHGDLNRNLPVMLTLPFKLVIQLLNMREQLRIDIENFCEFAQQMKFITVIYVEIY